MVRLHHPLRTQRPLRPAEPPHRPVTDNLLRSNLGIEAWIGNHCSEFTDARRQTHSEHGGKSNVEGVIYTMRGPIAKNAAHFDVSRTSTTQAKRASNCATGGTSIAACCSTTTSMRTTRSWWSGCSGGAVRRYTQAPENLDFPNLMTTPEGERFDVEDKRAPCQIPVNRHGTDARRFGRYFPECVQSRIVEARSESAAGSDGAVRRRGPCAVSRHISPYTRVPGMTSGAMSEDMCPRRNHGDHSSYR